MPFREGKLETLSGLLVQTAIWSLSASLPEKTAQLSPWSWDDDDDFWYRRSTTRKPYVWERPTTSRDHYKYKPSSSSTYPVYWFIVGGCMLVGILAMVIKYLCDKGERSFHESSPTLHPPPAAIALPPNSAMQHSDIRTGSRNTTCSNIPSGGGMYNASSTYSAGDKPPDYSEVAFFDFTKENTKFPNVSPKPLETSPPKYEDENSLRY